MYLAGEDEKREQNFFIGKPKGRYRMGDVEVDNIKKDLNIQCELDSILQVLGPIADCREHDNEPLGSS
jgi:hypothetical protein